MHCADGCGYFYKAEGDEFAHCHFEGPEGWAPCEQEELMNELPEMDYDDYYENCDYQNDMGD